MIYLIVLSTDLYTVPASEPFTFSKIEKLFFKVAVITIEVL